MLYSGERAMGVWYMGVSCIMMKNDVSTILQNKLKMRRAALRRACGVMYDAPRISRTHIRTFEGSFWIFKLYRGSESLIQLRNYYYNKD